MKGLVGGEELGGCLGRVVVDERGVGKYVGLNE